MSEKDRKFGFPFFLCQTRRWFAFNAKMQCRRLFVFISLRSGYEAVKTQDALEIEIYYLSYSQILSVILSNRLGDGIYDTFMMIDETKCPPCSNVLCNPSEPPLPRRLNVSKWSNSLCCKCLGKEEVLLKAQGSVTSHGNPDSLFPSGFLLTLD